MVVDMYGLHFRRCHTEMERGWNRHVTGKAPELIWNGKTGMGQGMLAFYVLAENGTGMERSTQVGARFNETRFHGLPPNAWVSATCLWVPSSTRGFP